MKPYASVVIVGLSVLAGCSERGEPAASPVVQSRSPEVSAAPWVALAAETKAKIDNQVSEMADGCRPPSMDALAVACAMQIETVTLTGQIWEKRVAELGAPPASVAPAVEGTRPLAQALGAADTCDAGSVNLSNWALTCGGPELRVSMAAEALSENLAGWSAYE